MHKNFPDRRKIWRTIQIPIYHIRYSNCTVSVRSIIGVAGASLVLFTGAFVYINIICIGGRAAKYRSDQALICIGRGAKCQPDQALIAHSSFNVFLQAKKAGFF